MDGQTKELHAGKEEGVLQLVTFNLGAEVFALDILKVQEINRMVEITKVPKTPFFVEGVINLRGKVIPVIDLRKRFGLLETEMTQQSRIIVVEMAGNTVGLVVDSVSEVLRLPANTVEPPPPLVAGVDSEYIMGVGKVDGRLLIMLDINKVLGADESAVLAAAA